MAENQYPIDFDALEKGQYIEPELISERLCVPLSDQKQYQFKLLRLKAQIESERPDLVTKGEGLGIRVLTDEEASPYLNTRLESHLRGIARTNLRRSRIDKNNLNEAQRKTCESEDRIAAATLIAMRQAHRKQLRLEAERGYARALPACAEPEEEEGPEFPG